MVRYNKRRMRLFLTGLEKKNPRSLDRLVIEGDKSIWGKTDCLHCANCCKTMSPTYTRGDIKRISKYLRITPREFRMKWLEKDKSGDWLNKSLPCQFLDMDTNMCKIYAVRPRDCSGFPHHTKKRMVEYMHVHKQNIETCPATYRMVERLMEKVSNL